MESALEEEHAFWSRSQLGDVTNACTPRPRRQAPRRRQVTSLLSGRGEAEAEGGTVPRTRGRRNSIFQLSTPSQAEAGKVLPHCIDKQRTRVSPEGNIAALLPHGKSSPCTAQLRAVDFHSAREHTSSSFDNFTTASGSRLPHGSEREAETGAAAFRFSRTSVKSDQDDRKNEPDRRSFRRSRREAISRGTGRTKTTGPSKGFPFTVSRWESSPSFPRAPSTAESKSSKRSLFKEKAQLVSHAEKEPLTSKGVLDARGALPPVGATQERRTCLPAKPCIVDAPLQDQALEAASIRNLELHGKGVQAIGAYVCAETNAAACEEWACTEEKRAEHGAMTNREKTRRDLYGPTLPASYKTFDNSLETSEYPPSSTSEEAESDSSPDGLSWVDYPASVRKKEAAGNTCGTRKSAQSCWKGDPRVSRTKVELPQRSEQYGDGFVGRPCSEEENDRSSGKKGCLSHIGTLLKKGGPPKSPRDEPDQFDSPVPHYFEDGTLWRNGKNASVMQRLANTQREHRKRGSWTNAPNWNRRLSCSGDQSAWADGCCEHELCSQKAQCGALQRNISRKVSHTLRRKVGDAVSRLRRKRALASLKQLRAETWFFHSGRETSSTGSYHADEGFSEENRRPVPPAGARRRHQHPKPTGTPFPESQNTTRYETPWDGAGAGAAVQHRKTLCEEGNRFLTHRPPGADSPAAVADPVSLAQLSHDRLGSVMEKTENLHSNGWSRRVQPLTGSCAGDLEESDAGKCMTGSQFEWSQDDSGHIAPGHRVSAGTTPSTPSVNSQNECKTSRRPKHVHHAQEKVSDGALQVQQEGHRVKVACSGEKTKSNDDRATGDVEPGARLSCTSSAPVTQASADPLQDDAGIGVDNGAYLSRDASHSGASPAHVRRICVLDQNRGPAPAGSSRSLSVDATSVKLDGSQRSTAQQVHAESPAITASDIEASIDWIVEASSNPKLLQTARELLRKKAEAERNRGQVCSYCSAGYLPVRDPESSLHTDLSSENSFSSNTFSSNPATQTISFGQSIYSGTSSSRSSTDCHPHRLIMKTTKKGSYVYSDKVSPSLFSNKRRSTRPHSSRRHLYGEGVRIRSCTPDYDFPLKRFSRHKVNVPDSCLRTYGDDYRRKASFCYASSDVAWNLDQLI